MSGRPSNRDLVGSISSLPTPLHVESGGLVRKSRVYLLCGPGRRVVGQAWTEGEAKLLADAVNARQKLVDALRSAITQIDELTDTGKDRCNGAPIYTEDYTALLLELGERP